jgi:hypothetical protein
MLSTKKKYGWSSKVIIITVIIYRRYRKLLLWTGSSDEAPQNTYDTQFAVKLRSLQKNGNLCKFF